MTCPEISVEISAAKTVNSLFRITNKKQWMLGVFVNRRENIELDGVRILEFIDKCRRVLVTKACC